MDYLSGLIDGAILMDGIVRSVLAKANDTDKFRVFYDAELTHFRGLVVRCRQDEVRAYLEERA